MSLPRRERDSIAVPAIAPPRPFVERRVAYRRSEDQQLHEERALLARTLDVLAGEASAESRLASVLDLLARTAGANRAAVLADSAGHDRRLAVAVRPDEDHAKAEELARWLDATSPRSRARRAAAAPAGILFAVLPTVDPEGSAAARPRSRAMDGKVRSSGEHLAWLVIPSAGDVALGFEFDDAEAAATLEERLPPQLARHAAVALALVTDQLATAAELEALRAREVERTRFVSTVAHELRTPLTGLAGYFDLILDGRVDDPAVEREFLERGQGIVETMAGLVGDLLELSRIESGTLRLETRPFSVADVGGRVVAALEPLALARAIELEVSLPARIKTASGDRRRVEQILTNLMGNALKFSAPGAVVELAARFDGSVAVICMRDDGVGIAQDDRARIFERFYRMSGHERVTGTGLGLPIARDLARAMGGDLDVASVPGSGSSFVLVLPGPTAVDDGAIEAVLARALAAEEFGLEERAVIRALQLAGRSEPVHHAGTRRIRPSIDLVEAPAREQPARHLRPLAAASRSRRVPSSPRTVTLRAIDGGGPLRGDPTPA
jgi:signal transduction histidine kinase